MLKSDFFEMPDSARRELLQAASFVAPLESWFKPGALDFFEVRDLRFWQPERPGFHFVPDLFSLREAAAIAEDIAESAADLALACFAARTQRERVADLALLFVAADPARLRNLLLLHVLAVRPASLDFLSTQETAAGFTCLLDDPVTASQVLDDVQLSFARWVTPFILELLRWKAPPPTPPSAGEGGGKPSPRDEGPAP